LEIIINVIDFKKALTVDILSESQIKMLKSNYEAYGHNITATELSKKMNFLNYNAANLHYGTLGRLIGERLGIKKLPEQTVGILVTLLHYK
jgi:hypothetical protein